MFEGLNATFGLLRKVPNEAAVRVLVAALDSPYIAIREAALEALLFRKSVAGHREVLRRLHTFGERPRHHIFVHQGRMLQALRSALVSSDVQLQANGCRAAVWFREYDLVPALVAAVETPGGTAVEPASQALIALADLLYAELANARPDLRHRDPQLVRRRVVHDLEESIARYSRHSRREIVDAYLRLVGRDNAALRNVLLDPHHAAHGTAVESLATSSAPGTLGLLASFVDDPHAPAVALATIARRADQPFLRHLLRRLSPEIPATAAQNLKRVTSVAWIGNVGDLLPRLDGAAQRAAVLLLAACGAPRAQVLGALGAVLEHGRPEGREAAAAHLAEFSGDEADALVIRALADESPEVQSAAIGQVRRRTMPAALPRLLELVHSPHADVQRAVRESLGEFSFARFLAAFDMLSEDVRRSTGILVKRVDTQTLALLEAELRSALRTRRLRGAEVARAVQAVPDVEVTLIAMLNDEDHLVRAGAARSLAAGVSDASCEALREALADRSQTVQEAARESLATRERTSGWRNVVAGLRRGE